MTRSWPIAGLPQSEAPPCLRVPGMNWVLPAGRTTRAVCKDTAVRGKHAAAITWTVTWLNPGKASLYKLQVSGGRLQRSTPFSTVKTSLVGQFPCLLNPPPARLEWLPLSSVSPCRPCAWASFTFHPGSSWVCRPARVLSLSCPFSLRNINIQYYWNKKPLQSARDFAQKPAKRTACCKW